MDTFSWGNNYCPQNELVILMMCKFLQKGRLTRENSHKRMIFNDLQTNTYNI